MRIGNINNINTTHQIDNSIKTSLSRLSSGLRINSASDDASGMMIADSLRTQANTLAQSQKNINDAMGIINIADKAINEQVSILDTIKTKLIQSANDGQTTTTRKAIQNDISKLMQSYDNITNTTSYNGKNLLAGMYDNQKVQVGANANETITLDIGSNTHSKVGNTSYKLSESVYTSSIGDDVSLTLKSVDGLHDVSLESVHIGTGAGEGLGALVETINKNSAKTGVRASAEVVYAGPKIYEGYTSEFFAINGVTIGNIYVEDNDSSGTLVSTINSHTDKTGVTSYMSESGEIQLRSDGRAISVESGTGGTISFASSANVLKNERGDSTYLIASGDTKTNLNPSPTGQYMFTIKAGTKDFLQ